MSSRKFPKSSRLTKKIVIQELFNKGSSFYSFPIKFTFLPAPPEITGHQVLISVSKRNFKKAVSRNKIKRLIREAYRNLQDEMLVFPVVLSLHYTAKEINPYSTIFHAMQKGIEALKSKY
jgi:ribonuclease P protein component